MSQIQIKNGVTSCVKGMTSQYYTYTGWLKSNWALKSCIIFFPEKSKQK